MIEIYLITAKCVCRVFEHNDGNIKEGGQHAFDRTTSMFDVGDSNYQWDSNSIGMLAMPDVCRSMGKFPGGPGRTYEDENSLELLFQWESRDSETP